MLAPLNVLELGEVLHGKASLLRSSPEFGHHVPSVALPHLTHFGSRLRKQLQGAPVFVQASGANPSSFAPSC